MADQFDLTMEEGGNNKSGHIQGYIDKSMHLLVMEFATQMGVKPMTWIEQAIEEKIERCSNEELTSKQRMYRDYLRANREALERKMIKSLGRSYIKNSSDDKLARLQEYCDDAGMVLKELLDDIVNEGEASTLYDESDIQTQSALDWARSYFKGKDGVPSKTVEAAALQAGIKPHVLKDIKALLAIPSRRQGSMSYQMFPSESPILQKMIASKKPSLTVMRDNQSISNTSSIFKETLDK